MRVFHLNKCGLSEESSFQDWKSYLYQQSITSICQSGSSSGRWILPCIKCHDKSSCFWDEIRWDPVNCHYPILKKNTILKCLSNKKVTNHIKYNHIKSESKFKKKIIYL